MSDWWGLKTDRTYSGARSSSSSKNSKGDNIVLSIFWGLVIIVILASVIGHIIMLFTTTPSSPRTPFDEDQEYIRMEQNDPWK